MAARGEKGSLVGLQEFDPVADVPSVPEIAVKAELCTKERGAEFCDQLFARVIARAKAVLQIPIKPRPMGGPMGQLVENRTVKMVRTLECPNAGTEMKSRLGT